MTNYPAGPSPYAPPPRDPVPGQLGPDGSPGYPYGPDSAHARREEAAASSSRTPLIIIGVLVLIIVMAAMALFSVRLLTNSAGAPQDAVAPVGPAPVELDGSGGPGGDLGGNGAGDGSLPLHFGALAPPDTALATTQCRTGVLTIHPENAAPYDVDGARCLLAGTPTISDRPIEFLTDAGWARYVDALLQGAVPGHDVQLLNNSDTVSVGTSRALSDDAVTLHYVDTYAQLAVEVIDVEDPSEAARVAFELGWL